MAKYRISGVWKNSNNIIAHYAFHTITEAGVTRALKKSKDEVVRLLEITGSSATACFGITTKATGLLEKT